MTEKTPACPRCTKPLAICICDRIEPVPTQLRVVMLQHPQEDDEVLGTAKLVELTRPNAQTRGGLSWGSLDHALGTKDADKDRWAVLAAAKLQVEIPEEARGRWASARSVRVFFTASRGAPPSVARAPPVSGAPAPTNRAPTIHPGPAGYARVATHPRMSAAWKQGTGGE